MGTRIKGPGDSLDTDMDTKEQFFGGAPPPPLGRRRDLASDGQPPFVISCMPMAAMNSFGFGDTPPPSLFFCPAHF